MIYYCRQTAVKIYCTVSFRSLRVLQRSRSSAAAYSVARSVWSGWQFGKALDWFQSYLHGRTYSVTYGSSMSDVVHAACSVLQGSVLGPLLFVLYTAEHVDIAAEIGINIHIYADDNQLYVDCKLSDTTDALAKVERCIAVVVSWTSGWLLVDSR